MPHPFLYATHRDSQPYGVWAVSLPGPCPSPVQSSQDEEVRPWPCSAFWGWRNHGERRVKGGEEENPNVLQSSFLYICIEFNGLQITFTCPYSHCPFGDRPGSLSSLGLSFLICKVVVMIRHPTSPAPICCEDLASHLL